MEFTSQPHDVHAHQGQNVIFPCTYNHDSLPSWNINGQSYSTSSDLPHNHVYTELDGTELTVRNVSSSINLWQYSCFIYLFSPETRRIERCESAIGVLHVYSNMSKLYMHFRELEII